MAKPAKLKVALVLDDGLDKPDGVQQYILSVGHWLTGRGHEVHYLVGQTARRDIANTHSLSRNVRVSSNGNRLTIPLPTSRRKLRQILVSEQFDVLHVQTPYSPFMGGRLVALAGPRTAVVGTFHILPNSPLYSLGNWLLGLWCHRTLKRFDAMLSVSPAAAQFALKTFGVRSDISPNVIDYGRFAGAQPLPQYDDDVLTILFLGRLVPRKGCQVLIKALAILKERDDLPKFRLVICGHGPLESQLKRIVQKDGLEDMVEFAGFVDEDSKTRYYASADIAVFPSSGGESFGIVLIEAMAGGHAVVLAGNNPGYASVMAAQPDLLFDPFDATALADRIAVYLLNSKRRQQMAAWGMRYAQQFDVSVVGPKLVEVYNKALRKRSTQ
ncbi:MAG TPA: glycosyltransferase family 4 protein [Candidatus Dormibacteraeota bacterium]|nr:glycosyltransferase family 4 protein [Candidatus Dormibacteraeota bacterium]